METTTTKETKEIKEITLTDKLNRAISTYVNHNDNAYNDEQTELLRADIIKQFKTADKERLEFLKKNVEFFYIAISKTKKAVHFFRIIYILEISEFKNKDYGIII